MEKVPIQPCLHGLYTLWIGSHAPNNGLDGRGSQVVLQKCTLFASSVCGVELFSAPFIALKVYSSRNIKTYNLSQPDIVFGLFTSLFNCFTADALFLSYRIALT
jgi:hypothetical protein